MLDEQREKMPMSSGCEGCSQSSCTGCDVPNQELPPVDPEINVYLVGRNQNSLELIKNMLVDLAEHKNSIFHVVADHKAVADSDFFAEQIRFEQPDATEAIPEGAARVVVCLDIDAGFNGAKYLQHESADMIVFGDAEDLPQDLVDEVQKRECSLNYIAEDVIGDKYNKELFILGAMLSCTDLGAFYSVYELMNVSRKFFPDNANNTPTILAGYSVFSE